MTFRVGARANVTPVGPVADLVRRCFIACGAAPCCQAPLGCDSSAHPCGGLMPQGIVLAAEMVQLLKLPLEAG